MALQRGTRLGPYEVTAQIGVGGMGEVYQATDTKLKRQVAIKVLPETVAGDKDRLARFRREAHILASLNHPNIAAIHGLEESVPSTGSGTGVTGAEPRRSVGTPVCALVMELVTGEDLAERLRRGAIPVDEAIAIAKQIAEALEEAHEHGIVHRDLKPGNIKVTPEGKVKVLDFGLAKALEAAPGLRPAQPPGATDAELVEASPTMSRHGTETGIILGTAAYMSPEQAKGKPVDKRADIWSFGVVLFEMLTGNRLFDGETVSDVLAAVLTREPDWKTLPAALPGRVRGLLRDCFVKDPKQRLRDIGVARITLGQVIAGTQDEMAAPSTAPSAPIPPWRRSLPWALVAILSAMAALLAWAPWRADPEPATPMRLSVELGVRIQVAADRGPTAILSPDGKLLAFTARLATGPGTQLHLRRLEQLQSSPVAGTEGARDAFFSPDSQWIGFFSQGKLKKVAVGGGAVLTLCDAPDNRGGTWSDEGTIFFTPRGSVGVGLSRVSAAGGTPEVMTTPDQAAGEIYHRWPQALPGGKAVLFTAAYGDFDSASLVVQSLPNGSRKVLLQGAYHGRYLRSGHIVYVHEGTLFAVPFDLDRLELLGPPAPVLEGVTATTASGGAQFAFSDRGTLVFLPGESAAAGVPIQWMDKDGKTEPLRALAGNYNSIRFSPDGQRLAMQIQQGRELDVWVYEWWRDTMSRLTFDSAEDSRPEWTPDGRRIAFASTRANKATTNIYWQRADGTGEAERLTESKNTQYPASWHPTGRFLAYVETDPRTGVDIMILPLEGDETAGWRPGKPTAFLNSPFGENHAAFSPDGKWLAYRSDESGQYEVYVRPFPGPGGKWQVSTDGGGFPTWSRNRKELFYRTLESTLMVIPYAGERDSFRAEKPRQWSPGRVPARSAGFRAFDLHSDGQRFAVLKAAEQEAERERGRVVLILNFFEELRRVAPAGKR